MSMASPTTSTNSKHNPPKKPKPPKKQSASPTASQSWSVLLRHARDEITPLRLQELCHDHDRVTSLISVHSSNHVDTVNGSESNRILLVDLSRQRMTTDTLNHLLVLASARDVKGFVERLSWGQNDPDDPVSEHDHSYGSGNRNPYRIHNHHHHPNSNPSSPSSSSSMANTNPGNRSMHIALRAPPSSISNNNPKQNEPKPLKMLCSNGTNSLESIHKEWARISKLSANIRIGKLRGVSGMVLRHVVVVGRGVAVQSLRFFYEALRREDEAGRAACMGGGNGDDGTTTTNQHHHEEKPSNLPNSAARQMRFVSSIDPVAASEAVSELVPGSTIIVSLSHNTNEEMGLATKQMYNWLMTGLAGHRPDVVATKHMFLITGNERLYASKPDNTFLVPDHSSCEAFTTFTSAGLLPLAIVFGWRIVEKIIAGAHDMDTHFIDTNPRHNLPILLALVDLWNDAFLGSSGRVISPFSESFSAFPSLVAALESENCGRNHPTGGASRGGAGGGGVRNKVSSAVVMNGGLHGEYDRMLYQGGRVIPSELIIAMEDGGQSRTSSTKRNHNPKKHHHHNHNHNNSNSNASLFLDGVDGGDITSHDALMCSFFSHADVMAFGNQNIVGGGSASKMIPNTSPSNNGPNNNNSPTHHLPNISTSASLEADYYYNNNTRSGIAEGNRPSTLLVCSKCDAFTCGQLLALSEHRAAVLARLWDVDPFVTDVGSSLREMEFERLKERLMEMMTDEDNGDGEEEDEEDEYGDARNHKIPGNKEGGRMNFATSTVLRHYANRIREQKYVVKNS